MWSKLIQKAREEESNRLLMFLLGLAALLVAAIGAGAAVLAVSFAPGSSGATQTTSVATDKATSATSGPSARATSPSRSTTTTPERRSGGASKAGKTSQESTDRPGLALADSGQPSATGATQSKTRLGRPTSGQKGSNPPSSKTGPRPASTTPTKTPSTTPSTTPTTPSVTPTTTAPTTTTTAPPSPAGGTNCTIINQNEQSGEHNSNTTSNQLNC
jgi:hypothetical protein